MCIERRMEFGCFANTRPVWRVGEKGTEGLF